MIDVGRRRGIWHRPRAALGASSACRWSRRSPCSATAHARPARAARARSAATCRAAPTARQPGREAPILRRRCTSEVRRILAAVRLAAAAPQRYDDRIDRVVLHPVWGLVLLAVRDVPDLPGGVRLGDAPMDVIEAGTAWLGAGDGDGALPDGPLRSLLVDGIIAGVGGVIVFLPQILILFVFILALEESGYLPRAAFLLDRLMGGVGLSGRSFIPLLSSFACAIPGIMATRTIAGPARPAGHDPGRAADDLLGAAAGLRAADRRLHPAARRSAACSTCRAWCCSRSTSPASLSALAVAWVHEARRDKSEHRADDGAADLPHAAAARPRARPVGARADLPQARRRRSSWR